MRAGSSGASLHPAIMAARIDTIRWFQPWRAIVDDGRRESLESELKREAGRGHPLHGVEVRAVARRMDMDEVCYELGESSQLAVVRLKFALAQPLPSPETRIYDDVDAFVAECMMPDHRAWAAAHGTNGTSAK